MLDDVHFETECPFCGAKNEGQARMQGHDASIFHADALFVCAYCAAPAFMQEDQTLRLLTVEELQRITLTDQDAVRTILGIAMFGRSVDAPKRLRWIAPT